MIVSWFDSYLEAQQDMYCASCQTAREKQSVTKHKLYKSQVQQERKLFTTAVFKQLRSDMSVFITGESAEAWSASLELQLDSGLHHRSERFSWFLN